jgi:electron transport complex protein RnfE
MSLTKEFTKGFWELLAPFRLVLGLCPVLAVTGTVFGGIGMGLATTFVLVCSNVLVSLLRKVIPAKVRIAAYIVIIASFVSIVDMLLKAYQPDLHKLLGIFIQLIVVNCILLGRAEAFASKQGPLASTLDGLGIGLGFTLSLGALGALREILGAGTITLYGKSLVFNIMGDGFEPFAFMIKAPGAFVGLGVMLAAITFIGVLTERRKRSAQ